MYFKNLSFCLLSCFFFCPIAYSQNSNLETVGNLMFNCDWLESRWESSQDGATQKPNDRKYDFEIAPVIESPISVAEFILKNCGDEEVVYPSERYFYYQFRLGHRLISGNLRFADIEKGIVHLGFFNVHDRSEMGIAKIENGVNGIVLFENNVATVTFRNITRRFRLDQSWHLSSAKNPPKLYGDEQLVSGVLDESGFYFWLIYSKSARRLYYVLNGEAPLPEQLIDLPGKVVKLKVGFESRFVFLYDIGTDRWILTGISQESVKANNYFDGTFDQVPPNLDIKEILEHVYPYCKLRGGIDKHGNFNSLESQRMAISPYSQYVSLTQFVKFLEKTYNPDSLSENVADRWADVVYESKMDFHSTLAKPKQGNANSQITTLGVHEVGISGTWPANHFRKNSIVWPNTHTQTTSLKWPSNHAADKSKSGQPSFDKKKDSSE